MQNINKEIFAKTLRFLFLPSTLAIKKGCTKRKSTAIKINLSAANAPPPKGYYLFLLHDDLECDTFHIEFHKTRDPSECGRVNSNSTAFRSVAVVNSTDKKLTIENALIK